MKKYSTSNEKSSTVGELRDYSRKLCSSHNVDKNYFIEWLQSSVAQSKNSTSDNVVTSKSNCVRDPDQVLSMNLDRLQTLEHSKPKSSIRALSQKAEAQPGDDPGPEDHKTNAPTKSIECRACAYWLCPSLVSDWEYLRYDSHHKNGSRNSLFFNSTPPRKKMNLHLPSCVRPV